MEAQEFKDIRSAIGLTQSQLSHQIDMTVVMISYYENGKHPIPKTIASMMKLLGMQHEINKFFEEIE